jgi:hypothetical protein
MSLVLPRGTFQVTVKDLNILNYFCIWKTYRSSEAKTSEGEGNTLRNYANDMYNNIKYVTVMGSLKETGRATNGNQASGEGDTQENHNTWEYPVSVSMESIKP